jgi:hypothetical protein
MGFFLQFLNVIPMEEQIEKNHLFRVEKEHIETIMMFRVENQRFGI